MRTEWVSCSAAVTVTAMEFSPPARLVSSSRSLRSSSAGWLGHRRLEKPDGSGRRIDLRAHPHRYRGLVGDLADIGAPECRHAEGGQMPFEQSRHGQTALAR